MGAAPSSVGFDELPRRLPIFPLAGALLLPGGRLPLNIFEPRYLAMTRDAMAGQRMIGMVQPLEDGGSAARPAVYRTGCAGRITEFSETKNGRFRITLSGVCRFRLVEELAVATPYRQVIASYARFRDDLGPADAAGVDRERLLRVLRAFLEIKGIGAEWGAIDQAPTDLLVNSLAMICPFAAREKQALLEAETLAERARVMTALMEMATLGRGSGSDARMQ
jgi:hypothetical protein